MPTLVFVLACALLAVSLLWQVADSLRSQRIGARRRVIVNLVDECAITGVLWKRTRGLVLLRGAELIEPGRAPVPMDGEVVIERDRVSFVQIVSG